MDETPPEGRSFKARHGFGAAGVLSPVLAIAAVVLLLLWARDERPAPRRAAVPPVLAFPVDGTSTDRVAAIDGVARPPPAPEPAAASMIERCGLPSVPRPAASDVEASASALDRELEPGVRRLLDALAASGDVRTRAAGLYIQAHRSVLQELQTGSCPDKAMCEALAARSVGYEDSLDRLARIASVSGDALVYGWAVQTCARATGEHPACGSISGEQWARLDADNGAVWLAVAEAAGRRGDRQAVDAAMHRLATSRRFDERFAAIADLVQSEPGVETLAGFSLVAEATGYEAAFGMPALHVAGRYCADSALADANRRETCQRIARVFMAESRTTLVHGFGVALGRRSGLSSVELAPQEQLRAAYREVPPRVGAGWMSDQPFGCAAIREDLAHLRLVARAGERAAMEAQIAASGRTVAELAAEAAVKRARIADEQAASSASGPR